MKINKIIEKLKFLSIYLIKYNNFLNIKPYFNAALLH